MNSKPTPPQRYEAAGEHNYYVSASEIRRIISVEVVIHLFIKKLKDGTAEMIELKIPKGYSKVNGINSGGAEVFYNGKTYISPDVYGHNGGIWKMAKKVSEFKIRKKTWNVIVI